MASRKWLSVLITVPAVVVIGTSVVGSQSTTAEEPAASDGATSNEEAALSPQDGRNRRSKKPTLIREPESSALLIAAEKLRAVFRDLEPPPTMTTQDGTLVSEWKTRKFMVHGDKRGGVFAENATEEVGPGPEGFLLSVQSEPVGTLRAAVLPRFSREPYWDSHIDVYKPEDSSEQLYWELKYGMRTDKDLIRRIGEAMGGSSAVGTQSQSYLEGTLRIHPKYLYKHYLEIDGSGQKCAVRGEAIEKISDGTRIQVRGRLESRFHPGGSKEDPSPFGRTWFIEMEVQGVKLLPTTDGGLSPTKK